MSLYSTTQLARSGLVNYWRQADTSGTTMTDSKGSNSGTLANGFTLNQAGLLIPQGDLTPSTKYQTNGLGTVTNALVLRLAQFTVEAIIYPTAAAPSSGHMPVAGMNDFANGWALDIYNGSGGTAGELFMYINNTGVGNPAVTVPLNTVSHVALSYNGTAGNLYLNGVLAYSVTRSFTPTTTSALVIGGWAGVYFNGFIQEVSYYNRALTTAELQLDAGIVAKAYAPWQVFKSLSLQKALIKRRTVVNDANYTTTPSDLNVVITALTATRVITLTTVGLTPGQEVTIQDESGQATTYPVVIAGSGVTLGTNYGRVELRWNGTTWVPSTPATTSLRPARAYTSSYGMGQSLAAGVGAMDAHGSLKRVAATRGLPYTNQAVGGSVAHWHTMASNASNGNGGFAKVLQDLTMAKKNQALRPFFADGITNYVLYLLMHGFNTLYVGGGVQSIPAEIMAIRTLISRCLTAYLRDISSMVVYSAADVQFGGGWSNQAFTDRNTGAGFFQTSAIGDYGKVLTQSTAANYYPPGTVLAITGLCQSGDTGTITFHDDTASVALGTLDISAAAPPISVRTFLTPASGTYTLTYGGQTTTALAAASTAATIQSALQALSSIGTNNCVVTGAGAVSTMATITLTGTKAGSDATITASAGTIGRIMSPWVKRFVIGVDIPAYSANLIRYTLTAGGPFRLDSVAFESPMPNPVVVTNTVRPTNTNPYGFVDVPTRDAAIATFNTALQAMCAEFNRPGLEAQALYVDLDSAFNKNATYWTWAAVLGATDGIHWGDDGHALGAQLIDAALTPAALPPNNHYQRARAA